MNRTPTHAGITRSTLAAAALATSGVLMFAGCGGSDASSKVTSAVTTSPIGSAVQSASQAPTSTSDATAPDAQGSGHGVGGNAGGGVATSGTGRPSASTSTHGTSTRTSSTGTSPAAVTPVTAANLPSASVFALPGSFYDRATIGDTGPGSSQAPLSVCQTHGWGDYHPTAEFTRDVSMAESANRQNVGHGGATIASFATHAAAVQAASAMARSLDCSQAAHTNGYVPKSLEVRRSTATLSGGETAHLVNADYGIADDAKAGGYSQVGVVASGTRVELIAFEGRSQGGASPQILVNALNAALPALHR